MSDTADTANVIIRPPIAWALAVLAALALQWLMPLPFMPAAVPSGWVGGAVFAIALALVAWAIATITRAGSNVPTNMPTTTIVETGPYRFTRNPIYLGMCLGLVGLAVAFNNLWLLGALVPFDLVIRYGVVAREEVYLDDQAGIRLARQHINRAGNVGIIAHRRQNRFHRERPRGSLECSQLVLCIGGSFRVEHHPRPRDLGRNFFQEAQPLAAHRRFKIREPGDIAARPRQARDETAADRIGH